MRSSAIALSSLLHALALALILSSDVFRPAPLGPDEPIAIELVLEAELVPPETETEPAKAEPPEEPDGNKETPLEPELARELPPVEDNPPPEQAEVAELAQDEPAQPLEPIETPEPDADPREEPELPVIAIDLPPPPMKPLSQDTPALAERTLPEATPLPVAPEPSPVEPLSDAELDTIKDLAKSLAPLPPLPQRKPPELEAPAPQQAQEPPEPPPATETTAALEPDPSVVPPLSEEEPVEADETPYTHQGQIGDVAPDQLLANIEALRNEDLQAERNPELWEVIRLVRRQMARCWREDPRKPWSADYSVDIQVSFSRQGALKTAFVQEVARMVGDESFKDFVIEAKTALQACSPFDLPEDKYGIWRRFTMRFVPRRPG